jgi:hypothetical protein
VKFVRLGVVKSPGTQKPLLLEADDVRRSSDAYAGSASLRVDGGLQSRNRKAAKPYQALTGGRAIVRSNGESPMDAAHTK